MQGPGWLNELGRECKNKADEQYMPLLLKDIDKIFKINMSRPVKKRKENTGFFSMYIPTRCKGLGGSMS
jgi:hypothetical protein